MCIRLRCFPSRRAGTTVLFLGALLAAERPAFSGATSVRPNVLIVTIDTLRADRLASYGYARNTAPHLERWIARGARFSQARTVEPLTAPALVSMVTSQYPHEHGASRNGLRMRPGLESLPKLLAEAGYRTAAFVGNWTMRDKLSGMAEHFHDYGEVLTRKRWWGLACSEATADDLTADALSWLDAHVRAGRREPFLLWVHYVEPHAPYRLREEFLAPLGIAGGENVPPADRYDTEIAYVDHSVGELLRRIEELGPAEETLVIFTSDHGESLGEHNYWGHGRNLYEPTLRIPLAMSWAGRIEPRTIDAPALIIDVAPTIAGLLGLPRPAAFRGYDFSPALGGAQAPLDRVTHYQAHRGAVLSRHNSEQARKAGLLEVAVMHGLQKAIYRLKNNRLRLFDLGSDPGELVDLGERKSAPTEGLQEWMHVVLNGLDLADELPAEPLDPESLDRLRALGYTD